MACSPSVSLCIIFLDISNAFFFTWKQAREGRQRGFQSEEVTLIGAMLMKPSMKWPWSSCCEPSTILHPHTSALHAQYTRDVFFDRRQWISEVQSNPVCIERKSQTSAWLICLKCILLSSWLLNNKHASTVFNKCTQIFSTREQHNVGFY